MKNIIRTVLGFAAVLFAAGLPFAAEGNSNSGQAADKSGDYVLTSARIFVSSKKEVQVDEKTNIVLETMLFHGELNAPDKVTGKCVLEYTWTIPSGRFSSKALDKIRAKSSITAKEASGEWTVRPKEINMNLFFFKASDKELLATVTDGKMADASPSALFKLKIMSLLPDQPARIEEMVSNNNQSKWLPFARSWQGKMIQFTPRDYPRAVLVVKVKGLLVDGYACYVYEYDPEGTKTPIQK